MKPSLETPYNKTFAIFLIEHGEILLWKKREIVEDRGEPGPEQFSKGLILSTHVNNVERKLVP